MVITRTATATEGWRCSVLGMVFARIIVDRICHHLLEHKCTEQSGFTLKRSTIDCVLALRVLTKCRWEFQQRLPAAHVGLNKAFNSVSRDAIWRIFGLRGVATKADQSHFWTTLWTWGVVVQSLTYFQLLPELVRGVYWTPHFSTLVWTGFWGGYQRGQAVMHYLGTSGSLTLI